MRGRRSISPSAAAVEFVPRDYFAPLDLRELFPREAPLDVDIGCGDGAYLAKMASANPAHNFLGIERLAGRIRSACNKIARLQLENARVLLVEANYAVRYLLPPKSVSAFHILFPDPWPKRRHQTRRVLNAEFLRSLHRALKDDGVLHIATDQLDYFEDIREVAAALFATERSRESSLRTTFQQRYEDLHLPIYRVSLRKTSVVR